MSNPRTTTPAQRPNQAPSRPVQTSAFDQRETHASSEYPFRPGDRLEASGMTETVVNGEPKTWFHRCGTAFVNRDGSINVILESVPLSGRLNLRRPLPKQEG